MKIERTIKYELDIELRREHGHVYIIATGMRGEGDEFMRPNNEWQSTLASSGFDGLEDGAVLDAIDIDNVDPELLKSDSAFLDAYFNSPYGVS